MVNFGPPSTLIPVRHIKNVLVMYSPICEKKNKNHSPWWGRMQCILKHNTGYDRSDLPEILSGWFMKPNSLSKTPLVCLAVCFYHKLFLVIKSFKIQEPLKRSLFTISLFNIDKATFSWIEQSKIKTCILKYASNSFYNEGIFFIMRASSFLVFLGSVLLPLQA